MKYRVMITEEAEAGIRGAFHFIEREAPLNAERWLKGMREAIDGLKEMPGRYAYARENDRHEAELRQVIYKSHRIIFMIEGKEVQVLYVRHGRMDEVR